MQQSYSSKVQFRIFNRKELQKNTLRGYLTKCSEMDAYDNEMAFWKLMRSDVQPSRGIFSRNYPKAPQLWLVGSEGESFEKYGSLEKRKIKDIIADMRKITEGTSANGGINLKAIDWTQKKLMDEELRRLRREQEGLPPYEFEEDVEQMNVEFEQVADEQQEVEGEIEAQTEVEAQAAQKQILIESKESTHGYKPGTLTLKK